MPTLSEAEAEMYKNFGGPPDDVLDRRKASGAIVQALALYDQKLALAGRRRASAKTPTITPNAKDFIVNQPGFTDATAVERQVDIDGDEWDPVRIVEVDNIAYYERNGDYAIAFYGYPEIHALLSWDPRDDLESNLRFWYFNSVPVDGKPESRFPSFPNFLDMVVAKACVRPSILAAFSIAGEPWRTVYADVTKALVPDLEQWEEMFDHYLYETVDQGPGQFDSIRYDRGGRRRHGRVGF